jgi:hypothetical protein
MAFAAFYLLDDTQLWFHRMELNGGCPTWPQFIQLVNAKFGPPLTDSPIGELAMLRHTRTVYEFSKRFIALSCRDTSLIKARQIQLFLTGLGDPLRTDVALQQPSSLDDVVIFARAYKQCNTSHAADVDLELHTGDHQDYDTTSNVDNTRGAEHGEPNHGIAFHHRRVPLSSRDRAAMQGRQMFSL